MKKLIFFILQLINRFLYINYDTSGYKASPWKLFKIGFFQKIIGFNRNIPWPVDKTTTISAYKNIKPGDIGVGMSKYCHIDARNGIEFGNNVWVGPYVKIISMNHDSNDYSKYIKTESIKIGNNCWIGAGAIILPGVEIGDHTIVAAGAVVTKTFNNKNQILAGSPAKVVKTLPDYLNESEK